MNMLAFDSIGGASGDMILASLIDLGIDPHQLSHDLESLGIGHFHINPMPCSAAGLHGIRLEIKLPDHKTAATQTDGSCSEHDHAHAHADTHGHTHGHSHEHGHDHGHGDEHGHGDDTQPHSVSRAHGGRGLREIRQMINASQLPQAVKDDSCAIFQRLAEAEARVHHSDPETVHFHEVGALDSILDIVGCCLARHRLGVEIVQVSPLPLGRGVFKCRHGLLPIPAPATAELLKGLPVQRTDEPFELVTPTGAAILGAWNTTLDAPVTSRIVRTGHGFGTRTLSQRPNLLRAMLLSTDSADHNDQTTDACLELICNLDDMTPEWIGPLIPRLLEGGALDAFVTAVQMKKQRPGCLLTVLCRPDDRMRISNLLFAETSTFGIRWRWMDREILARRHITVTTPYGPVRVKIGQRDGIDQVRAPEYEDCLRQATVHHVSVREVYAAALSAAASAGGNQLQPTGADMER